MHDIRVEGLQRISEGTVYNYLPVNVGDRLDRRRVEEALKALYATGFFKDVEVRREAVQKPWNSDTGFENGFNGWTTTGGMWDIGTATGVAGIGTSKVAGTRSPRSCIWPRGIGSRAYSGITSTQAIRT